jgi:hypothetical protein
MFINRPLKHKANILLHQQGTFWLFGAHLTFGTVLFGKMSSQNPFPGKCFETEMKSYCSFSRQFKFYFNIKNSLQFKLKVIS